jgi:glucose/arabinose dehydrogenase
VLHRYVPLMGVLLLSAWCCDRALSQAMSDHQVLTGEKAFGDWRRDAPGVRRLIRPGDLPPPDPRSSAASDTTIARLPAEARPNVPAGFDATMFASGLSGPRAMRVAPNGDVFVAESRAGRIRVLRPSERADKPSEIEIFASSLDRPFGIAFYPVGPNPEWVYVANTDSVVRFPYRSGDLKARGAPETVVSQLPSGGHWTRDIVFSKDGSKMFVSVGSASNVANGMRALKPDALDAWKASHPLGATWGSEEDRADVLMFDPTGRDKKIFATGIRNCVGLAVHPATGDLWCSTNERDGLGDDTPPDYVTRVREGAFYGWPWYFIGSNEDPRLRGERPDLKSDVTVPDVLLQAHSASLQLAFNDGNQFPSDYRGDGFAAEHGSWNRSKRTGYKVIRVILKNGVPTGEYEDFATGFGVNDDSVWGRPVGVAFLRDGSLLISEDANGTIWRVSYRSKAARN